MNATLLCLAMLVPGYGEKDILKRIEEGGGGVERQPDGAALCVWPPSTSTDTDLGDLCELRRLTGLGLGGTQITDKGLRTVGSLRWLERLSLTATTVTDEGIRHLESMSNLRELHLRQCPNITDEGVARLQKTLPKCTIHR
jgi:hypothetical protein